MNRLAIICLICLPTIALIVYIWNQSFGQRFVDP